MSKKTCLYTKQYRRLTVDKIKKIVASDEPFVVEAGRRPPFVQTWVMPKRSAHAFDREAMLLYVDLMFASSVDEVLELCPKHEGRLHINKIKHFMAEFVIVGRKEHQTLVDLHRDGIIHGTTEHLLYVMTLHGVDLGPLHGTAKAKAKPEAKPKAKAARKQIREALLGPDVEVKRPARPAADVEAVADEAYPAIADKPRDDEKDGASQDKEDADEVADLFRNSGEEDEDGVTNPLDRFFGEDGADTSSMSGGDEQDMVFEAMREENEQEEALAQAKGVFDPEKEDEALARAIDAAENGDYARSSADARADEDLAQQLGAASDEAAEQILESAQKIQCCRCKALRTPPPGMLQSFTDGTTKFFCRIVSAQCSLTRARPRVQRS